MKTKKKTLVEICPHLSSKPMEKPWGRWKGKTQNVWLKRIWKRVYRRNQNYLCITTGETGSGKSYSVLKLCEMLDPNFSVDNVVFDAKQFIALIRSKKIKAGSAILFEELGVAANARNWHSDENIWLSFITQIFRTMNLIVFYTVPRLDFVDGQIAKLAHAQIEAMGIDYIRKQNNIKVFDPVQFQGRTNKWYKHFVSFRRFGKTYKVGKYVLNKASNRTCRLYEKKRDEYLTQLSDSAHKFFDDYKQGQAQKDTRERLSAERTREIVDDIIKNKDDYMDDRRFFFNKLMDKFGVGSVNARRIKYATMQRLKEMGYVITWRQ